MQPFQTAVQPISSFHNAPARKIRSSKNARSSRSRRSFPALKSSKPSAFLEPFWQMHLRQQVI